MGEIIESGAGDGRFPLRITSNNRAFTDGINESLSAQMSRDGMLYGAGTGYLTTTWTDDFYPVLWLRNDDPDNFFHIQKLIFGWNGGTSSKDTTVQSFIKYQTTEPTGANSSSSPQIENISKLDAAERQLKTAIRLFFGEGDVVSIHTLVAAADGILTGLCQAKGVPPGYLRDTELYIKPEGWFSVLNESQNFFKHADRDYEYVHEYQLAQAEGLIMSALWAHKNLTNRPFFEGHIFFLWWASKNPNLIIECPEKRGFEKANKQCLFENLVGFKYLLDHPECLPESIRMNLS